MTKPENIYLYISETEEREIPLGIHPLTLAQMQDLVGGGYIQAIPHRFPDRSIVAIVNEEGRLKFPHSIARYALPIPTSPGKGELVYGPYLLMAKEGEELVPLTRIQLAVCREHLRPVAPAKPR